MAHLGADVIKLESPDHLCMFRRLPLSPPDSPPSHDTSGLFQIYNTDKRSVSIDLSHADAAEVVARLVAVSDVVIDNFGVGVMDRLGFGAEQLRAINPDVVIASLSGYGSTGPCAEYVAYGPAGGALAGLYASNGYEGGPAFETGVAIGDPCTGITAAWAVVASLAARRRSGIAATIDVAMAEAVAATVGEGWMQYLTEGRSPAPIGNHDPIWSPHNCYRTQRRRSMGHHRLHRRTHVAFVVCSRGPRPRASAGIRRRCGSQAERGRTGRGNLGVDQDTGSLANHRRAAGRRRDRIPLAVIARAVDRRRPLRRDRDARTASSPAHRRTCGARRPLALEQTVRTDCVAPHPCSASTQSRS